MRREILLATALLSVNAFGQVNPISLGRASNVLTITSTKQNQVFANDSLGVVGFIHQQDVTIFGGGATENGKFRYDISSDGGATFTNDLGALNPIYPDFGRSPQMVMHRSSSSTSPWDQHLIWAGTTNHFPTPGWIGFVGGCLAASNTSPASTEHYFENVPNTDVAGGLTEGLNGEFWMASFEAAAGLNDSLFIYKGTFLPGTQDIDWGRHDAVYLDYFEGYDGEHRAAGPNMAFSPNGTDGWIGFVGDLNGGSDTTNNPIFIHSTDGGATWGTPMEVDLTGVTYLSDNGSLGGALIGDFVGAPGDPEPTGLPTCLLDYDLTVDMHGNPHMFLVVGNASTSTDQTLDYAIEDDFNKLAVDISSQDGGATWEVTKIAPVYTREGEFGMPDNNGQLLKMENFCQISRTMDGSRLFYSWTDSDTTVIGFGETDNLAPNLRIAGLRVTDHYVTCPKWVTKDDLIWDGNMLFPTMAPEVLTKTDGYKLPIVAAQLLSNNQNEPTQFHYFGNDAIIDEVDFIAHSSVFNSDDCTDLTSIDELGYEAPVLYPNPVSGVLYSSVIGADFVLMTMEGKVLKTGVITNSGIEMQELSSGMYFVKIGEQLGRVIKN